MSHTGEGTGDPRPVPANGGTLFLSLVEEEPSGLSCSLVLVELFCLYFLLTELVSLYSFIV